jgi:UDP-2-acetamido-3-amino-2,3-dideoxy-glucuronate N-acetyltransferase
MPQANYYFEMETFIDVTAKVDGTATIGSGVRIWQNVQIREMANLGENVSVGKDSYLGVGVVIGDNSKVQNGAMIFEPALISNGVFVGPGVIFTNDKFPRAVNPDLTQKTAKDWNFVGVKVGMGASIGAGAICVAPLEIGPWSVVAAGAVVTRDVPAFTLVMGCPARPVALVNESGQVIRWLKGRRLKAKFAELIGR